MAKAKKAATPSVGAEVAAPIVTLPTLVSVAPYTGRQGTARAVAHATLQASLGSTRSAVLVALQAAETAWHVEGGRSVKGINPGGWLRLFSAQFTA